MEKSIFTDRDHKPDGDDLSQALGKNFQLWLQIREYVMQHCPSASEEWNFSGFGWNCRIRDKKRVVIYLMPCEGFFNASFVLGSKAVADALAGKLTEEVKATIAAAKVYAEGTGFRLAVRNKKLLADVITLTDLKLKY